MTPSAEASRLSQKPECAVSTSRRAQPGQDPCEGSSSATVATRPEYSLSTPIARGLNVSSFGAGRARS